MKLRSYLALAIFSCFAHAHAHANALSRLNASRKVVKEIFDSGDFCQAFNAKSKLIYSNAVKNAAMFYAKTKFNVDCIKEEEIIDIALSAIKNREATADFIELIIDYLLKNKAESAKRYYLLPMLIDDIFQDKDLSASFNSNQKIKLANLASKTKYLMHSHLYSEFVNLIVREVKFGKNGVLMFFRKHGHYVSAESMIHAAQLAVLQSRYDDFIEEVKLAGFAGKLKAVKDGGYSQGMTITYEQALASKREFDKALYLKKYQLYGGDLEYQLLMSMSKVKGVLKFKAHWGHYIKDSIKNYYIYKQENFTKAFNVAKLLMRTNSITRDDVALVGYLGLYSNNHIEAIEYLSNFLSSKKGLYNRIQIQYLLGKHYSAIGEKYLAHDSYAGAAENPFNIYGQAAVQKLGMSVENAIVRKYNEISTAERSSECCMENISLEYVYILSYRSSSLWQAYHAIMKMLNDTVENYDICAYKTIITSMPDQFSSKIAFTANRNSYPIPGHTYRKQRDNDSPMTLAVLSQETGSRTGMESSKNALGAMQLRIAAAKEMAREQKIVFDDYKLKHDLHYSLDLGSAYLRKLYRRNQNDYAVTFAGYNAGPANIKKWVNKFGYPGSNYDDIFFWIDRIPYAETKNYLHNTLASCRVYAALIKNNLI